jgi:hypothetical protein
MPLLDDSRYALYDPHVLYNVLRILDVPHDNSRFFLIVCETHALMI